MNFRYIPISLALALLCCSTVLFSQINISLQPDGASGKDAQIFNKPGSEDTNFGTFNQLHIGAWTYSSVPGTHRSLLAFDLSGISASATILSATLYLTHDSISSSPWGHSTLSGSNEFYIRRITSAWDEMTVTWNNQPSDDTTNQAMSDSSTTVYDDYAINVTDLVQAMVDNPSTSFGFMMRLMTEQYYRYTSFATSDHIDSFRWPRLDLSYMDPLAIDDASNSISHITVSPNPASASITVHSKLYESYSIEAYNIIGRRVIDKQDENKIDVSNLAKGLYYLRIYDGDDHIIGTSKFIKE
ncbi:MAG: hypothetical protein COB88_01835 [Flavobacteriales bacterium]|nr:MAG: hypothetical protein COB88_01835 [Flavobacteriales bacterium]